MADPNVVANPSSDPSFMSASPEDRHGYMMATDKDYASAAPEDQQAYLQHLVTEGAKANIAKYPQKSQQENHWMGKLVPQAATPIMQKITESAPIQAAEAIGQKGAQFGHDVAEQAVTAGDVLTHPVESFNAAVPSYGPKPMMRSLEQTAHEEHPVIMGAATGIGETVGGLADPRQALLMALSGGTESAFPVLSKITSGAFGAQMGAGAVEAARDLQKNWAKYTPEQRANVSAHIAADAYFAKQGLEHTGIPGKIGETVRPLGNAMVRGAGHVAEQATTPAVIGGATGAAVDAGLSKLGVPIHGATELAGGYLGRSIAEQAGRNPNEPIVRFPRMTQFGKPTEDFVRQDRSIYGPPAPKETEAPKPVEAPVQEAQPVDKGLETLKTAYDTANTAYQKAYEAREAYRASMDQGVEPPAAVTKAFEKAQKALDEAQFHYETAIEGRKQAPPQQGAQPEQELTNPPIVRGGQQELPGGGVMGKPLQLKGEVPTENPAHANVPDLRARMVPAKETAGEYQEPQAAIERPVASKEKIDRIGQLAQEGLGGKALEPNKPLREQVPAAPKPEVLAPEQPQAVAPEEPKTIEAETEHPVPQVRANGEALANAIPKTTEGHVLLQKLHDLSNVELRQLAINAGEDMGQLKIGRGKSTDNIPRSEVFERMLKNHTPDDLGRMVDEGKHLATTGEATPPAPKAEAASQVEEAAPKAEEPKKELSETAQKAQEIHEKYNEQKAYAEETFTDPEEKEDFLRSARVSRDTKLAQLGASGGTAAPATGQPEQRGANTEEAVAKENDWFKQAKEEKPDASLSEQLQYAQELKNKAQETSKAGPAKDLESYNESIGKPKPDTTKVVKDPRAVEVADAYEAMKHDPENPQVKKAYNALKTETKAQWEHLKSQGYTMDLSEKDPYKSYEEMAKDVKDNKHISVYDGKESHPPADHPMSEIDPETGLTYNSLFRAVHDIMGHAAGDNDFSERGEENAYNLHRQAYSNEAIPAMTTETKGQTSTFFNNKAVREGKAEPGFPEQKANLLPKEVYEKGAHEVDAAKAKEVVDRIKSGKDFAVLQAENPQNDRVSDAKNAELTNNLFNELKKRGYNPVAVGGNTKDVAGVTEHAFFVPDISPEDAVELGKKYDQQGILTSKGLHDLNTGSINPIKKGEALKTGDAARGEQYYTTVGNEDFNVPLDFDKRVNMKGSPVDEFGNPTVSGGNLTKAEAKRLAEEHLTDEEKAGVTKTEKGNKSFIDKMMSMPGVREVVDIAQAGEGSRKWYQRSQAALGHIVAEAPEYFGKPGDLDRFTGLLAASSPRQSVAMNIREALNAWKNYVDEGRPTGKPLEKLLRDNFVNAGGKVPNAMKALAGEQMWPDLTKNRAFKVPSFRDNLSGILNRVTNDGWMALFSGLTPEELSSPNSYHPISVITREAAKQLGWEPAEAQAAIWSFVKTFVDKAGLHDPHDIRHFSEDMADIVKHDPETRNILEGLKVNLDDLDKRIKSIGPKPEIAAGNSPTLENSIGKLAKRIKGARGEAPTPKDSGLFDNPTKDEGDTSFNPDELDEGVKPKAVKGAPRDEFGNPTVSGGSQSATAPAKAPITQKLIDKYGTTDNAMAPAQFIDSEGNRIPVQDHDRAVAAATNKKVNPDDRIGYMNDEKAVRVRFRSGQAGKEVVFSIPDKVSPEQIKQMEKTVAGLGKFGNMHVEQAQHGGNSTTRINATSDMVRDAVNQVNRPVRMSSYPTQMRDFRE